MTLKMSLLNTIFYALKNDYFSESEFFKEVSMGMSGDYQLAIEKGSTMIRVGSNIFGARNLQIDAIWLNRFNKNEIYTDSKIKEINKFNEILKIV